MEVTDEMRERMARIRANRTALDNCPRHAFGELPAMAFGMKLTCQRCGGVMDAIEAAAYARGFEAAGGNPDEIISDFRGDDTTPVTCPKCLGVCGFETSPGDWHDCDLCDCAGTIDRASALTWINEHANNKA